MIWNKTEAWRALSEIVSKDAPGPPASCSHRLQHAAVDEGGRTDAVGGFVGAEENEEVGELLGAGESFDGCVLVRDALQITLPVASLAGL